jgi:SanA protein
LLVLLLAVSATTWLVPHHLLASAQPLVCAVGDVPVADCILVKGARIYENGEPQPMLVGWLAIAKELFGLGKAPLFLVRGRVGGDVAIDEVAAMRC